jgi:Flp pilus assembly protein TadB
MPPCISHDSWGPFLVSVSPAVAALLSAIALWVASRARTTSKDVQSISSDHEVLFSKLLERPTRSESRRTARVPKKSSTRATISTSPGDTR